MSDIDGLVLEVRAAYGMTPHAHDLTTAQVVRAIGDAATDLLADSLRAHTQNWRDELVGRAVALLRLVP